VDDLPGRAYTGRANARQHAVGRRWADRWARYPALSNDERLADFEAAEQQDETERNRHS